MPSCGGSGGRGARRRNARLAIAGRCREAQQDRGASGGGLMALVLGKTKRGKEVALSSEERSRHIHMIGASGTGKSKLMESMIRQDILAGRGLCLIDPHGTLCEAVIKFCASRSLHD